MVLPHHGILEWCYFACLWICQIYVAYPMSKLNMVCMHKDIHSVHIYIFLYQMRHGFLLVHLWWLFLELKWSKYFMVIPLYGIDLSLSNYLIIGYHKNPYWFKFVGIVTQLGIFPSISDALLAAVVIREPMSWMGFMKTMSRRVHIWVIQRKPVMSQWDA